MGRLAALLLLLAPLARGQTLPYSFQKSHEKDKPDVLDATSVQEDFEFLANQAKQNKAAINALTVTAGVQNVTASNPLSSSGGANPNITFSGTLAQSQVTGLVAALAGKAATFTGISSSCASGFTISSGTWVNGVLTGGGCVAIGSGSGGTAGTLGYLLDNLLVTGTLNGVNRTFTLTQTPSTNSENVDLNGTLLSPTSDYTLVGNTLTLSTAPAAPPATTRFFVRYSTGASGIVPVGLVGYLVDNLLVTGTLDGSNKTFTLSQAPSVNSEQVDLNGTLLAPTSDYVLTGASLVLSSAPAAPPATTRFYVRYSTGASGVNAFILNSSQTVSGATTFLSSVTFGGILTSTANYSSIFINGCALVAQTSTTASALSIAYFTGIDISTGYVYYLNWNLNQTGTGGLKLRFDNNAGAGNYQWTTPGIGISNGGSASAAGGGSATLIDLNGALQAVGFLMTGEITIEQSPAPTTVNVYGNVVGANSAQSIFFPLGAKYGNTWGSGIIHIFTDGGSVSGVTTLRACLRR